MFLASTLFNVIPLILLGAFKEPSAKGVIAMIGELGIGALAAAALSAANVTANMVEIAALG